MSPTAVPLRPTIASPRVFGLRRFARAEGGATAVEFGLLALPLFFLLFAILEIAMAFWSSQVLETAVANAARDVYTGNFQTANASTTNTTTLANNFKAKVCANMTALITCSGNNTNNDGTANNVAIDIRPASSFANATAPAAVTNGVFDPSKFTYQTVGANQIAVVTAAYEYRTIVPMLAGRGGLTDGNRVLIATATFRIEPYSN